MARPLHPAPNPLLSNPQGVVRPELITTPLIHRRALNTERRTLRDLRNKQPARDPPLADFLNRLLDQIWAIQPRKLADASPYQIVKFWEKQM